MPTPHASFDIDWTAGPRRLALVIEETTDAAADVRRLHRICTLLDEHAGADLPVELVIQCRDGDAAVLRRSGIAAQSVEGLIPQIQSLLGVLGACREAGVAMPLAAATAAAG